MKHILLTTDLTDEAQRAFSPTIELAMALGAKVTLLHVVQLLMAGEPTGMHTTPIAMGNPEKERTSAIEVLEQQSASFPKQVDVSIDVITGTNSSKAVVQYADEHDVDLIALSTHGRSGVRRMVMGSVAEAILRHSHVPVLSIPPKG